MEDYTKNKNIGERENGEDVYSKSVRAGRRTYFFDVKSTRAGELYITITESCKKQGKGGDSVSYEKQKLYLYKEDFAKFGAGLDSALDYIREKNPEFFKPREEKEQLTPIKEDRITLDLEFDEL